MSSFAIHEEELKLIDDAGDADDAGNDANDAEHHEMPIVIPLASSTGSSSMDARDEYEHDDTTGKRSTGNRRRSSRRRSNSHSDSHSHSNSNSSKRHHDPLQKAESLLRRIIRPVLSYAATATRCAQAEAAPNQLVLDLCRRHPSLATQRFPTHRQDLLLSPFQFLISNKANVEVIQNFLERFPQAVQCHNNSSSSSNGEYLYCLDGYPLHLACSVRQTEGDIIAMLAQAFPEATRVRNQRGYLPLHLLLEYRGVAPALEGAQALLQLYPESTVLKAPVSAPPVFQVFSLRHCSRQLMECILSHVPPHVTSLQFPIGCFAEDTVLPDHAQALTKVLPQLQHLELVPPQWHLHAWISFVTACRYPSVVGNLRTLILRARKYQPPAPPPPPAPAPPTTAPPTTATSIMNGMTMQQEAADLIGHMVQNLTNLTVLSISVDYHPQEVRNLTQPLASLLRHGTLQSLKVDGFPLQLSILYQALRGNTSLRQLVLNELVVKTPPSHSPSQQQHSNHSSQCLLLSQVLAWGNVTLQKAATVSFTGQLGEEYSRIQYWTTLNRLGRAFVRGNDVHLETLVQILLQAQNDNVIFQGRSCDGQSILYGLLRETPGSWSNCSETNNFNSSKIQNINDTNMEIDYDDVGNNSNNSRSNNDVDDSDHDNTAVFRRVAITPGQERSAFQGASYVGSPPSLSNAFGAIGTATVASHPAMLAAASVTAFSQHPPNGIDSSTMHSVLFTGAKRPYMSSPPTMQGREKQPKA